MKKYILSLLVMIFLLSCDSKENQVNFTIIQVNDVYEIGPLSGGTVGGMSRVATLYKKEKALNDNTMMVLAGDFLSPSLLGTLKYKGEKIAGKQMVDVMNAMGFDLVVLGNHEFDVKRHELQKRIDESDFDWLATNVKYIIDGDTIALHKQSADEIIPLPEAMTYEIRNTYGKSASIGFVGATINANPKDYVLYEDYYDSARRALESIEDQTDIVFGLTHLSLDQDKEFLRQLPEIPLSMGGHEHYNMDVTVGNSRVTKADANAKSAYVHRISLNIKDGSSTIESSLVNIDESLERDPEVAKVVDKWLAIQNAQLTQFIEDPLDVIFTTNEQWDGTEQDIRSRQTNLGYLISESLMYHYKDKVDAAFINSGSIRIDDNLEGEISGVDIFRILPFGGSTVTLKIKGELLAKTLNFSMAKTGSGAYFQFANINYNLEDKRWYIGDEPIKANKFYNIATSKFMLSGYDIPFFTPENKGIRKIEYAKEGNDDNDIRKLFINYLKSL